MRKQIIKESELLLKIAKLNELSESLGVFYRPDWAYGGYNIISDKGHKPFGFGYFTKRELNTKLQTLIWQVETMSVKEA